MNSFLSPGAPRFLEGRRRHRGDRQHHRVLPPARPFAGLVRTPWQTEGPFYPDRLRWTPTTTCSSSTTPSPRRRRHHHISGRILRRARRPGPQRHVEIWQWTIAAITCTRAAPQPITTPAMPISKASAAS